MLRQSRNAKNFSLGIFRVTKKLLAEPHLDVEAFLRRPA